MAFIKRSVRFSFSAIASMMMITGCGANQASFSLLGEQDGFSQTPIMTYGKIDVLWVIDNSGSMDSSQQNIKNNFSSFINEFKNRNIDFRMAVITSDAYRSQFTGSNTIAKFRDGLTTHTGVFVVTPNTPNLDDTFVTNLMQGTGGNGDERPFQSLKALSNPINASFQFPRPDAFLSVIIVSDEDDFSNDTSTYLDGQYSNPAVHPVSMYADYLSQISGSTTEKQNFNVNSITIMDQQCLDTLNAEYPGRRIGQRYMQLTSMVGGETGSLCGNFAETLQRIAKASIDLTARFALSRTPDPATIVVTVDGVNVPESETDGWTYEASTNSLIFHGASVPGPGAYISVTFDPTTIK